MAIFLRQVATAAKGEQARMTLEMLVKSLRQVVTAAKERQARAALPRRVLRVDPIRTASHNRSAAVALEHSPVAAEVGIVLRFPQ